MIIVSKPVTELYESIIRPAISDVINNVIDNMGMRHNTMVTFNGDSPQPLIFGSNIDETQETDATRWNTSERIFVSYREETPDGTILTTPVKMGNNRAVFHDVPLGIAIKPVYYHTEIILTFSIRARDRQTADRWRTSVMNKASQNVVERLHEINYHYPLSKEYLYILGRLWELRENVAGYGETFQDWLRNNFNPDVGLITQQNGENGLMVVRERQVGILGWYDFDVPPVPEKGSDGATWTAEFDYHFCFDKPNSLVMQYPLMVHNQIIPEECRDDTPTYTLDNLPLAPSFSRAYFDEICSMTNRAPKMIAGIRVPEYDSWYPSQVPRATTTCANFLLQADPNNLHDVINLTDLGDVAIHPKILEWMKKHPNWLSSPNHSPFLITLYKGYDQIAGEKLSIDKDLNVTYTDGFDLRAMYHLRLAIVNDLSILDKKTIDTIRQDGELFLQIIQALEPSILVEGLGPKLIGNYVPKLEFYRVLGLITSTHQMYKSDIEVRRLHVGNFFISIRKGLPNAHS